MVLLVVVLGGGSCTGLCAPLTGLSLYAPEANELVVTVVIFISRCDGSVISQIISPPPPPATTCMVYGTAYSTIRLSR